MRSGARGSGRRTAASRRRRSPFAGAGELFDLPDDQVLLQPAQPIDKDRPLEMIHLVLKAARQQARGFNRVRLTAAVEPRQHGARWTGYRCIEAGDTQAALFLELHAVAFDELRVDEGE